MHLLWSITLIVLCNQAKSNNCPPPLSNISGRYQPSWDSLESRPLPIWYDDAKIGILIHWGVFSVPGLGESFWKQLERKKQSHVSYLKENYKPKFSYTEFAPLFTAEMFDPDHWANMFLKSGAKYVILTSKLQDGFAMWPAKSSWQWNAADVGPHKDLLGSVAGAVRKLGLYFGVYYSLYEWFHPLYLQDKANDFKTRHFVETKIVPDLIELVKRYLPEVVWANSDWDLLENYWCSKEFIAWLYNESPVKDIVAVNDRWGCDAVSNHGGFLTNACPENPNARKWEYSISLDKHSLGFNRMSKYVDYMTIDELIATLVTTVSCGGNILINVGPTADGRILPIMEERLLQMGEWLMVNGEAIYKSEPWTSRNDSHTNNVFYTKSKESSGIVFVIFLTWPKTGTLILSSIKKDQIAIVGLIQKEGTIDVQWTAENEKIQIVLPPFASGNWGWVLRIITK